MKNINLNMIIFKYCHVILGINRLIEILEFANVVDSNLFVIPKGFKIYALVQNDTSALLRQNKIVEEY